MLNCTLTGRGRNVGNEKCLREITAVYVEQQERQWHVDYWKLSCYTPWKLWDVIIPSIIPSIPLHNAARHTWEDEMYQPFECTCFSNMLTQHVTRKKCGTFEKDKIFLFWRAEKAKKNLHTLCGLSSHRKKKKLQVHRTTHKGKVQDFVQLRKFHTFSRRYFESAC